LKETHQYCPICKVDKHKSKVVIPDDFMIWRLEKLFPEVNPNLWQKGVCVDCLLEYKKPKEA
jgi:hypothetical protein